MRLTYICKLSSPCQMEELLKEVALSERKKQQIDAFVQTVTKLLQNVQETPKVEVCST